MVQAALRVSFHRFSLDFEQPLVFLEHLLDSQDKAPKTIHPEPLDNRLCVYSPRSERQEYRNHAFSSNLRSFVSSSKPLHALSAGVEGDAQVPSPRDPCAGHDERRPSPLCGEQPAVERHGKRNIGCRG